jgi:tRNA (cmo5U34)-methyltransferase
MTHAHSRWQTAELATTFLEGVRGGIPGADLQMAVIAKIAQHWCPSPARMLDLGCGDGILGRCLLEQFPEAQAVFADFSPPMLNAVTQQVRNRPQAEVVLADFGTPDWVGTVASHGPFDIVVSGFAIHHQPDERKRAIYGEIFQILSSGGMFLNLEHVASLTAAGEQLFDDFFVDYLYRFHRCTNPDADRATIADTYYRRPDKQENILAPVDLQCQWLRQIGYDDVDCFFKTFELALFGGRKP